MHTPTAEESNANDLDFVETVAPPVGMCGILWSVANIKTRTINRFNVRPLTTITIVNETRRVSV